MGADVHPPTVEYINANHEDQMRIYGYRVNRVKQLLTWLLIVASAGLLRLVFFWKPEWMLYATNTRCSLHIADKVLLFDRFEQIYVEKVVEYNNHHSPDFLFPRSNGTFEQVSKVRCMENRKTRYIWNYEQNCFFKIIGLDFDYIHCSTICAHRGLDHDEQHKRLFLFGENSITIKIESISKVFFTEVLNPFYIYQFFAIGFWAADEYYYYASYILLMSLLSLILTTYQIRKNQRRLRDKVCGSTEVCVCRGKDQYEMINSSKLVPGDVMILNNESCQLYCDLALLNGEVIVNESMLTGESNPVTKTPIRDSKDLYDHKKDAKHILFAGTSIIQVRQLGQKKPRALVIRTNFETAKGELVKSILFPKPLDFKFSRHINHFLFAMSFIAMIGFIYTVVIKIQRHDRFTEILFKAIDLITIVVPPELPAALTIATMFVDRRLRNRKIFCMSPRAINISGCVDCVCFDKTGTLTEESIDLEEVLLVQYDSDNRQAHFGAPCHSVHELVANESTMLQCLATCHSLKLFGDTFIGENLEVKLFNWTGCTLHEPTDSEQQYGSYIMPSVVTFPEGHTKVGILKQFPFTSKAARMSVIVTKLEPNLSQYFEFYIKGAPETIIKMCNPQSVPDNFVSCLENYTRQSFRVIALAYKRLPKLDMARLESDPMTAYESDLNFLGLIIMRNKLKQSTKQSIKSLNDAQIRSIMVTGDNLMTALSVALECDIISRGEEIVIVDANEVHLDTGKTKLGWHLYKRTNENGISARSDDEHCVDIDCYQSYKLAMTGNTFKIVRELYPELLPSIMVRCAVYARMAPEQKQQLVETLQSVGYYVAMCGDGANDCGALKVAHAGISLSDTEASVASAFTSLTGQISCVVDLLREGRASLVSVFGVVRYMACYNITTFLAICILYYFYSALTDIQNLYQDIVIISLYIFLFGRTFPYPKLSPVRPPTSLIGIEQFSSILLQLALVAVVQISAVFYLHSQAWFVPHHVIVDETNDADYVCHDNYALFIVQVLQYVTLVVIFSKGAPYRLPIYSNKLLSLAILVTTLVTLFIVLTPDASFPWVADFFGFEYRKFPFQFRIQLVALNVIHFLIALTAEKFIIDEFVMKLSRKYRKQPYDVIYEATVGTVHWIVK